VENAIKYSLPHKAVKISVALTGAVCKIVVRDQGIGLTAEEKRNVFEKFFRGVRAMKIRTEGSGLGMYLSKTIIEAHGGAINVESEVGKGTQIIIKLPLKNGWKK